MIEPDDLVKFGLIPKVPVGRLPVVSTLQDLDRAALVRVLTEPKNALVKRSQRLLDYEKLTLRFAPDALEAIADAAIERRVGARGLRIILEELMLDVMYSTGRQPGGRTRHHARRRRRPRRHRSPGRLTHAAPRRSRPAPLVSSGSPATPRGCTAGAAPPVSCPRTGACPSVPTRSCRLMPQRGGGSPGAVPSRT